MSQHTPALNERNLDTSFEARLLFSLLAVASLIISIFFFHTTTARASYVTPSNTYNCNGDLLNTIHCYGVVIWTGRVNGATSVVTTTYLIGGNGGVTNEMWVSDYNTTCQVDSSDSGPCWVEAGYVNRSGDNTRWFWADVRPCSGCYYAEHDGTAITSGDYGSNAYIDIEKSGSNSWLASISGHSTGISGTSTNNTMAPNKIQIGQELYGTTGASTSTAHFTFNQWEGTNYQWNYQGNAGHAGTGYTDPPYWGWTTYPSNSTYGGNFWTRTS